MTSASEAADGNAPVPFTFTPMGHAALAAPVDIHTWFGLSYANYLVLPRTLLQSMPVRWQHHFTALLGDLETAFAHIPQAQAYEVTAADEREVCDLTPAELQATGISIEEPCRNRTDPGDWPLPAWRDTRTGRELRPWERVLVPVTDPVPAYNRGRTRVKPLAADDETGELFDAEPYRRNPACRQRAELEQLEDIPVPDRSGGRWSAGVAEELSGRAHEIAEAAGYVPDYGAVRMAEELSRLLGVEIWADGVEELARRGLLPVKGSFKGYAVYDGRAAEAFADPRAAIDAQRAGELRTADESAAYLQIRRADLDHLTRAGLLAPSRYGRGPWDRKDEASVPLYRAGNLDDLTGRADIDWATVRQARKGQRSPLASLPRKAAS